MNHKKGKLAIALALLLVLPLILSGCQEKLPAVDWERCIIAWSNSKRGSVFCEVHADGSLNIAKTKYFEGLEAYLNETVPDMVVAKPTKLHTEQFEKFLSYWNVIYQEGKLIPPPEPDPQKKKAGVDRVVTLSVWVDGKQFGPCPLTEYEDYPPGDYTHIIMWVYRRYKNAEFPEVE